MARGKIRFVVSEKINERGFMIRIKRKNPIDHEFLKKIEIQKSVNFLDNGIWQIDYNVYLNNKIIGFATILSNRNFIREMQIEKKFQRKGVMSYLYDYIEKDRNIKLIPSENLLKDGRLFWKNRLKKSNPTDKEFLSKIKIKKSKTKYYIRYEALYKTSVIAVADFYSQDNSVSSIWIEIPYRRKGLASFMYDYIEKDQKINLIPSRDLLPDGRRFWENRLKNKPEKLGLLYR